MITILAIGTTIDIIMGNGRVPKYGDLDNFVVDVKINENEVLVPKVLVGLDASNGRMTTKTLRT
jgi:hypothetical protein